MNQSKAPALQHSLKLYNELKERGVQIILVSSRREHLRSATVDNLVNEGFFGWTNLILRFKNHFFQFQNMHLTISFADRSFEMNYSDFIILLVAGH